MKQKQKKRICATGILLWLMLGKCAEWALFTVKPYRQSIEMYFGAPAIDNQHCNICRAFNNDHDDDDDDGNKDPTLSYDSMNERTRVPKKDHCYYYLSIDFVPLQNALKCKKSFGNYEQRTNENTIKTPYSIERKRDPVKRVEKSKAKKKAPNRQRN